MQAEDKTVDIDTSGPGAEVQLEENKKPENETVEVQDETTTEDNVKSDDTSEKSDEQLDVQSEEQKTEKKEPIKVMKTNVKQNLKTVVAPMIHLRNLMSSLLLKNSLKKLKNKKIKDFLKMK